MPPLNRLEVLEDQNQTAEAVWLHYIRGGQTIRVSVPRTDIDDFAQQELPPGEHENLLRRNLETLGPVIEGKFVGDDVKQWTNPAAAQSLPLVELTRANLEQGLRRHQVTVDMPLGIELLSSVSSPGLVIAPDLTQAVSAGVTNTGPIAAQEVAASGVAGSLTTPTAGLQGVAATGTVGSFANPPLPLRAGVSDGEEILLATGIATGSATAISSGRGTLSITPATIPSLNLQDRAEILGKLDAVEARLRELFPNVEALQKMEREVGIGHNRPDQLPPIEVSDIELGAAAVTTMRIELSLEAQRIDVWDICRRVFGQLAARIQALAQWLGPRVDKFADSAAPAAGIATVALATATLATTLHVDLTALAALILALRQGKRGK